MNEYYYKFVDLWKKLCEIHCQLYDFTCDEYSVLLSGEVEQLEFIGKKKEKTLMLIQNLDGYRQEMISEIKKINPDLLIENVRSVIVFFQNFEKNKDLDLFRNLNELLIEIIEKIKDQNKRNQIFLNKSLKSFEELKQGMSSQHNHRIYNSKGFSIGLKST